MLSGKSVVLGVTGGIAAYKAADVVSRLKKLGAEVDVIMTKNATQFVAPLTFETLSQRPVTVDTFLREGSWEVEHIALAKKADLLLVAPATANLLAKFAHGMADDMLTTTLLATQAPVLLAPAMNTVMWEAGITQANLQALRERGVSTVGPGSGLLACGDVGAGRMSEPQEIVEAAVSMLLPKADMAGLRVLVTAGPTRERLDPVRYLTNDSSGKMGYALAQAAKDRGAAVTLVSGPVALTPPAGVEVAAVETTQDLYEAMLGLCEGQDVIVQAAAPADYRFAAPSGQKLKKREGKPLTLEMVENPDVAKAVGERRRPGQVLIGFAAETQELLPNASRKLGAKGLDLIVANDVTQEGAGFGGDTNIAVLVRQGKEVSLPILSKKELAHRIWDEALEIRQGR